MSLDAHQLYDWLPAILRIRDGAQAQLNPGWLLGADRLRYDELLSKQATGPLAALEQQQLDQLVEAATVGPLAALLAVFGEQFAALQEDLEQLYDDQFIETCADWVAPYIGDLVGYRLLHGVTPKIASPRAEVAHTIAYRRRKGTLIVLEQLARDVTGWNAKAVEYFQRLIVTQYMNHPRPQCRATPDQRDWNALQRFGSAFDPSMHCVDVRRITSGRGRYNLPNIGLHLWRIEAWPLTRSPAVPLDDGRRWRCHPQNIDQPLYNPPQTIAEFEQFATPLNVPEPLGARSLYEELSARRQAITDGELPATAYFADSAPFAIYLDDDAEPVAAENILICALLPAPGDPADDWRLPPDQINVAARTAGQPDLSFPRQPGDALVAVDPVRGRIALAQPAAQVHVDFRYGFSAALGGGEYDRSASVADAQAPPALLRVPQDHASIQAAIDALGAAGGVVEIGDSGRYAETLAITAAANASITLRAGDGHRPHLLLGATMQLTSAANSRIRLDGLLLSGAPLQISASAEVAYVDIAHCTLLPGLALDADCTPQQADAASLIVSGNLQLGLKRSISGALRVDTQAEVSAEDCIIDATATQRVAYAGGDGQSAGGSLQLLGCTVIGKLHALKLPLVSNAILLAATQPGDGWNAPVIADRRQQGCVRFSYLPDSARVPQRYRCLPESATAPLLAVPRFVSLRYGYAAYAQLSAAAGAQLLTGADNESQPGAFNFLFQPQRESNLRLRLAEYLRTGLQAGIFYAS